MITIDRTVARISISRMTRRRFIATMIRSKKSLKVRITRITILNMMVYKKCCYKCLSLILLVYNRGFFVNV